MEYIIFWISYATFAALLTAGIAFAAGVKVPKFYHWATWVMAPYIAVGLALLSCYHLATKRLSLIAYNWKRFYCQLLGNWKY